MERDSEPGLLIELFRCLSRITTEDPLRCHDFTTVRRDALTELATEVAPEELEHVEEAVRVFVTTRSDVDAHLFADALPFLEALSSIPNLKIAMISNGNCNSSFSPVLSKFLTLSLSAADVGIAKPSVVPFIAMAQRCDVIPSRVLYIGDSLAHDVVGAKAAGMRVAWLCRTGNAEEILSKANTRPDVVISSLDLSVLEEKFSAWTGCS